MEGKVTPLDRKPPPASSASCRGVPEADILAMLMHGGCRHLLAAGAEVQARELVSEALGRWLRAGLPHETRADGERCFDPAEVINGFKWAGLQGRDDFWRAHWIATGRRMNEDFQALDRRGPMLRASLVRRFDLSGLPDDAELLLHAPAPLAGRDHAVTDLEPSTQQAMRRPGVADGRISARLRPGPLTSATLGWSATLHAPDAGPAQAESLGPQEAELYLRPHEGLIRVGPRVRELAALWAAGRTDWDTVLAFRRGIGASFCLGVIGYEAFDASGALDWVLEHGWLDCLLGSALLVSLCRARGLPARLVGGHFLYPLNPANHSWAEIWIRERGWTSVDLIGWDLSAGDADAGWQGAFVGRIDLRLVTERPPRRVTGPMSLRLPQACRVLQSTVDGGLDIAFVDAVSGQAAFTDRVCVTLEPAAAVAPAPSARGPTVAGRSRSSP